MRQTIDLKEERLCLILDNSPIHLSKDVEDYFKWRMCSWIYLSPYTPELAPVELFFYQLKRQILTARMKTLVDLGKLSGRNRLDTMIKLVDWASIVKTLKHFISVVKQMIGELFTILTY